MSDQQDRQESWLQRVREQYRATEKPAAEARERLDEILNAEPSPGSRPWRLRFRPGLPLPAWAVAASFLVLVGGFAWILRSGPDHLKSTERGVTRAGSVVAENESTSVVRFVISAP